MAKFTTRHMMMLKHSRALFPTKPPYKYGMTLGDGTIHTTYIGRSSMEIEQFLIKLLSTLSVVSLDTHGYVYNCNSSIYVHGLWSNILHFNFVHFKVMV